MLIDSIMSELKSFLEMELELTPTHKLLRLHTLLTLLTLLALLTL